MSAVVSVVGIILATILPLLLILPFLSIVLRQRKNLVPKKNDLEKEKEDVLQEEMASQRRNFGSSPNRILKDKPSLSRQRPNNTNVGNNGDENKNKKDMDDDLLMNTSNGWRCACEGGFLPPGLLGNAVAVFRMGSGQCYHKQK